MIIYFLKKISYALLTIFGVVTVIFILFNVVPGDPARMMLDQNENAEQLAIVKKKYGFDKPLWAQYLYYLNDLSPISTHPNDQGLFSSLSSKKQSYLVVHKGKNHTWVLKWPYLRESFQQKGKSVSTIIAETLPETTLLALAAISIAIFLGLGFGIISALYRKHWLSRFILLISSLGISLPSFFSAILFSWLFGYVWHRFTGLQMTGSLYEVDDMGSDVFIQWKNIILPAIVLGIRPLSVISQLMCHSLIDILSSDYIRTARAKGLSEYQVITRHALKNALNPVITAVSGWFASMLAGAVFVEYIFGWNGIGKEIVNALNTQDLPVIMGMVLVIAISFIFINILVDIVYALLDPRVNLR